MISFKKLILPTLYLVILLLFACQTNKNDINFVGEGENWSSKVSVNQTNGYETYQIQINFKGYSNQDIETFAYYVETKNNGVIDFGENNASLDKEGMYTRDLPISNSPSSSIKDELVIKVEWNGKSEDFTLINE